MCENYAIYSLSMRKAGGWPGKATHCSPGTPMEVLVGEADLTNLFFFSRKKERNERRRAKRSATPGTETKALLTEPASRTGLARTAAPEPDASPLTSYSVQLPLFLISLKWHHHFRRHKHRVDLRRFSTPPRCRPPSTCTGACRHTRHTAHRSAVVSSRATTTDTAGRLVKCWVRGRDGRPTDARVRA